MATYYENKDLKNRAGVYQIRNLVNGKIYVGSSINLYRRCLEHFADLRKKTHPNLHLQNSFNKYGEENFTFEVIEFTTTDKIEEREGYYIDTLNTLNKKVGYNKMDASRRQPNRFRQVVCLETGQHFDSIKDAAIFLGYSRSKVVNISACCRHKLNKTCNLHWRYLEEYEQLTKDEIEKITYVPPKIEKPIKHKRIRHEHVKEKVNKEKDLCHNIFNKQCKPVVCVETGIIYPSAKMAAIIVGAAPSSIRNVCKSPKYYTIKGLHWTFA